MSHPDYLESNIPVRLHERAVAEARQEGELDFDSRRAMNAERYALELRKRPAPRRISQWMWRLLWIEEFAHRTGEYPRRNGTDWERSAYRWIVEQRTANLSTYQQVRLHVSPISVDIRGAQWKMRALEVEEFICSHGALPRRGEDRTEDTLAQWMNRQLLANRHGTLTAPQQRIVTALLDHHVRLQASRAA